LLLIKGSIPSLKKYGQPNPLALSVLPNRLKLRLGFSKNDVSVDAVVGDTV